MMRSKFLTPLILLFLSIVAQGDLPKVFSGHFISDRETTVKHWQDKKSFGEQTDAVVELLEAALGTLTVTTEGASYTMRSGDWIEKGEYEIVSINETTVVVKSFSTVWDQEIVSTIVADATGYWLYTDFPIKGYCERFSRVPPKKLKKAE